MVVGVAWDSAIGGTARKWCRASEGRRPTRMENKHTIGTVRGTDSSRQEPGELTSAFDSLRSGEHGALDRVVPLLYDDLRRLARQRLRNDRNSHTLGTTGVVHEAYLRLLRERKLSAVDRGQFLAAASNTMRRLLVDYARMKRSQKRGGGVEPLPLEEVAPFLSDRATDEMIELDDALARLEVILPRGAKVFEQKVFGGLKLEEIAEVNATSKKTVQRDWTAARAWLRKEVRGTEL